MLEKYQLIKKGGLYFYDVEMGYEEIVERFFKGDRMDASAIRKFVMEEYLPKYTEEDISFFVGNTSTFQDGSIVCGDMQRRFDIKHLTVQMVIGLIYHMPKWLKEQGFMIREVVKIG